VTPKQNKAAKKKISCCRVFSSSALSDPIPHTRVSSATPHLLTFAEKIKLIAAMGDGDAAREQVHTSKKEGAKASFLLIGHQPLFINPFGDDLLVSHWSPTKRKVLLPPF
jgi:hypothetical protein